MLSKRPDFIIFFPSQSSLLNSGYKRKKERERKKQILYILDFRSPSRWGGISGVEWALSWDSGDSRPSPHPSDEFGILVKLPKTFEL